MCVCLVADTPTLGPSTRSSKHILNASDFQTVSLMLMMPESILNAGDLL